MKVRLNIIILTVLFIVNSYYWFQSSSDLMLTLHFIINIILGGLAGYVLSDKLKWLFK